MGFSEENGENLADRGVLISRTFSGERNVDLNIGRNSENGDCSCITDSCFNGGALCSFNCANRYKTY